MKRASDRARFVVAAAVVVASVAALSWIGPWRLAPTACLALFACAGVAWIAAVSSAERARVALPIVCGVALLLRLFALGSSLELSDDVYRYVWEGELTARGISPYAYPPGAPELAAIRAELPDLASRVAHPEVAAVYPPLVQGFATLSVRVSHALGIASEVGAVWFLRILLGCADVLVLWPLFLLARGSGKERAALVAWGLCPLVVFEFAGSAHFDVVGIGLLCAALVALKVADARHSIGREIGASALFAAAILSKYLPIFVLPWLGAGRKRWTRALAAVGFAALAFTPFMLLLGGERGFTSGLSQYRDRWEAGSLVFRFARDFARASIGSHADPERVARVVVALLWLAWAVFVYVRVRERVRAVGYLLAGFLVLTPTLHPWYLIWVLPFVALAPAPAWLWLFACAPILYEPLAGWQNEGRWIEPVWLWPVFALPFFALLIFASRPLRART